MIRRIALAVRQAAFRTETLARSDRGIAVTEYGLLVTLIAIVVIGVIVLFGGGIQSWFGTKTGAITTY